jgi:phage terminase small subunit
VINVANKSKKSGNGKRPKGERTESNPYGLSAKHYRFCQEVLVDDNATAAYRRAGYKDTPAACNNAARLIGIDRITAAIKDLREARKKRLEINSDRVLQELACLAFSDIGEIMDFTGEEVKLRRGCDIPEGARRALASLKTKRYFEGAGDDAREVEIMEFKLADKLAALVKYGQHLGMFTTKHEHGGTTGGAIPLEIVGIDFVAAVPLEK